MIRRIVGLAVPVGSRRRATAVRIARNLGLESSNDGNYQRWIDTVEPWTASPARSDLERNATFHVYLRVTASASAGELERTVLSLCGQSYPAWTVSIAPTSDPSSGPVSSTIKRLRESEPRWREHDGADFVLDLEAGDTLAPHALYEFALVASADPTVNTLTADHDSLNQFGDRRTTPRPHLGTDLDAMRQFDINAGLVAHRALTRNSDTNHCHVPMILRHKRFSEGPILRVLPGANPDQLRALSGLTVVAGPGAPDYGTQVRYRSYGTEPIRVCVVVTQSLHEPVANRQRAELSSMVARAQQLFTDIGTNVSVRLASAPASNSVAEIVASLHNERADVGFLVDGSLRLQSPDIVADLLGRLLLDDTLAVSPVVTTPSGIAVDAGLITDHGRITARCGPMKRPPYDLLWTRRVDALSGRCTMIHTSRLIEALSAGMAVLDAELFQHLATQTGHACIIWPHHQVVCTYGLASEGDASPVLLWRSGLLKYWFGDRIDGYQPLNDATSESVW